MPRSEVIYDKEHIEEFVGQFLLTGCAETSYRIVFNTAGKEKNAREGALLLARADVSLLVDAKMKMRAAELALKDCERPHQVGLDEWAGKEGERSTEEAQNKGGTDLDPYLDMGMMLAHCKELAEGAESESVRLGAVKTYDSLLTAYQRREQAAADALPEELSAFLETVRCSNEDVYLCKSCGCNVLGD